MQKILDESKEECLCVLLIILIVSIVRFFVSRVQNNNGDGHSVRICLICPYAENELHGPYYFFHS